LAEHGWKSAPVVEDEELVGVVSRSDVIAALTRPDEAVATELGEVLAEVLQEPCEVGVHHGLVTIRGVRSAEQRTIARRAAQSVVGVQVVDVEPPPMSRAGG
jgi:CBS domain-containing protein